MTKNQRRLLAEKIMGWHEVKIGRYEHRWQAGLYGTGREVLFNDWEPDVDISQAMMLVKSIGDCLHLKEHGYKGKWSAMFCGLTTEWSHGNTAAKAICNAALKTLEK